MIQVRPQKDRDTMPGLPEYRKKSGLAKEWLPV